MNNLNLGRRFHVDSRDHEHLMRVHLETEGVATTPSKKTWPITSNHLDQGDTGTCVGHGWCNFLRCAPIKTKAVSHDAFNIYRAAVLLDPWKENDNEAKLQDGDVLMDSGTTVRAGAQAVAAMGELTSYVWAFNLEDAVQWVLTKGPVVLGTNWYQSMFNPDQSGRISITPGTKLAGGHCYLLRGVDNKKAVATFTNSWGNKWAKKGDFVMSFADLERLIKEDGEVCTAIQSK